MGPNSDDREVMKQLLLNGMDVARFNFSHGTHDEQRARYKQLREVAEEVGKPVAALLDTKGPEIRTGVLKDRKKVTLTAGEEIILTTEDIVGDAKRVHINYSGLNDDVKEGNVILIDDGLIELHVERVEGTEIYCRIMNGGELGERKGVNVPNVKIKLPALTDKDKEDIRFGIELVPQTRSVRSARCWTRAAPLWESSRRSRTRKVLKIWMRSSRPATESW